MEAYGMGLAVLEEGPGRSCVGNGGTSSGEASKRATRSLNEAFLDFSKVFAVPFSQVPLDRFWVLMVGLRLLTELLADIPPLSSFDLADAKLDFRVAARFSSSSSNVVVRIASWCRARGEVLVKGS
jgi:hypothetical protein